MNNPYNINQTEQNAGFHTDDFAGNRDEDDLVVSRFCENVSALCKRRRIPVSKFEHDIGLSVGYISRLRKNVSDLTLKKIILPAAKYFTISVDDLLFGNLVDLTGKEDIMLQSITQLGSLTRNDKMEWFSQDSGSAEMFAMYGGGVDIPLMKRTSTWELDPETGQMEEIPEAYYYSYDYGPEGKNKLLGDIYYCNVPQTNFRVFVTHIIHMFSYITYVDPHMGQPEDEESYEFSIFSEDDVCKAHCGSVSAPAEIGKCIIDLYKEIAAKHDHVYLEKDAWNALNDFLNRKG